jgi:LuxR family maltose regulon positive regulatory protein
MLAYVRAAEGDYKTAYELLIKASAMRGELKVRQMNVVMEPGLEQLRILLSRTSPEMTHLLSDAARRMEEQNLQPDADVDLAADYARERAYSDLARVLVALGRAEEALPLLQRLLETARPKGRQGDELRYLVIQALAFHAVGQRSSAQGALDQALKLAEPENYVRIFLDEGEPMAELLREAAARNVSSGYAAKLLALFEDPIKGKEPGPKAKVPSLVEPMSEREIEVLRLLAAGLKYRQVAEQLVVSLNTVRHHTKNVYSKLGVNGRAQAIARAEELDLL